MVQQKWETSLIYGEKMIVFSPILWRDLDNYIKFCRPMFLRARKDKFLVQNTEMQ